MAGNMDELPPWPEDEWAEEETDNFKKKNQLCIVKESFKSNLISLSAGDCVIVTHESEDGKCYYVHHNKNYEDSRDDPKDWVPTEILEEFHRQSQKKSTDAESSIPLGRQQSITECSTNIIKVLGLPKGTTKEEIRTYFENKRQNGGGKTMSIDYDKKNMSAIITFKDVKSADRVMKKLPLMFGDSQIHVELIPLEDSCSSSDSDSEEDQNTPKCTIEVRNFDQSTTEEKLELHFEKKNKSGGGGVVSCEIFKEDGFARITFETEEVTERVLQTEQMFYGKKLELKLYLPPPTPRCYSDRIFVSGITMSRDTLELVLEKNAKAKPIDFIDGEEEGTMLVIFDGNLDIKRMQSAFKFEKKYKLTIDPVAITNTIIVSNMDEKTTKDSVFNYFDNTRRSGGGEVVDIQEEDKIYKIQFEDVTCVSSVSDVNRTHILDAKMLDVRPYYKCLYNNQELELPSPLMITNIDSGKLKFLRMADLRQIFEEKFMSIKWFLEQNSVEIECTITKKNTGSRKLIKHWAHEANKAFQGIVDTVSVHKHGSIFHMIWETLLVQIEQLKKASKNGNYLIVQNSSDREIKVIGYGVEAKNISQKINDIIESLECEVKKKQDETTDTIPMEKHKIEILTKLNVISQLYERFPNLQITISDNELILQGLFSDISGAKVLVLEKLMPIKCSEVGQFSQNYINFFKKDAVQKYFTQLLAEKSIIAVWEIDTTHRIMVHAMNNKSAVDAAHIIRESIVFTHSRIVPENSECLLCSEQLQDEIDELHRQFDGRISIRSDFRELCVEIYCVCEQDAASVLEAINGFLDKNILREQARKKSNGVMRYLERFCSGEISKIRQDLKQHFVEIKIDENEIRIKGNQFGLGEAKMALEKLVRKIVKKKHSFKSAGVLSQVRTPQGLDKIESVEESMECIIDAPDENDEDEDLDESTLSPYKSPKEWAWCKTVSGKSLCSVHGDITKLEVDAIVNAADRYLKMEGGLAKAITDQGGQDVIQDRQQYIKKNISLLVGDVYCGVPGKLNCKSIFHGVGPIWQGGNQREDDYLNHLIYRCLEEASNKRYKSIAIPGISTGIFNYPVKKAVSTIVEVISEFLEESKNTSIDKIYFCDMNFDVVMEFGEQLKEIFGSTHVNFSNQECVGGWIDSKVEESKTDRSVLATTFGERISLKIVKGDIAKQKVEVVVNLTSNEFDTESDPGGVRLFEKAGKKVKQQYKDDYPSKRDENELIVTENGNLPCKLIFHGSVPPWENSAASNQVLKEFLYRCLEKADEEQCISIAIPSVVTEELNYPPEETAKIIIKCFHDFAEQSKSGLQDIRLIIKEDHANNFQLYIYDVPSINNPKFFDSLEIIYPNELEKKDTTESSCSASYLDLLLEHDSEIFQKKLKEFESSFRGTTDVCRRRQFLSDKISQDADTLGRKPLGAPTPMPRSISRLMIGKLTVSIYRGDLPSAKADALICLFSDKYKFEGSGRMLFEQKGGREVLMEMDTQKNTLHKKGIAISRTGSKLPSRFIIMISGMNSQSQWKVGLKNALLTAEDKGCASVAFPTLDDSIPGKASDFIQKLHEAIYDFQSTEEARFLKEVQIVVYDGKKMNFIVQSLKDCETAKKGKKTVTSRLRSWIGFGSSDETSYTVKDLDQGSPPPTAEISSLTVIFYAKSEEDIDRAIKELTDRFESQLEPKIFEDTVIKEFNPEQIKSVENLGEKFMIEIKIEKRLGRIRLKGMPESVSYAFDEIHRIVRQTEKKIQREKEAKRFADVMQWCYMKEDVFYPYDSVTSIELEDAYKKRERKKTLKSDVGEFIVDFETMVEYPVDDPNDMVKIARRQAGITGFGPLEPPSNWKPMDESQNLLVTEVDRSDPEFKNVTRSFEETIGDTPRTIQKIELVQNKLLFQQYIAKRDLMRNENKKGHKNEKYLWHGTSLKSVSSINSHGFNRSYCGKHATLYGQGVYFATQSKYSVQDTYSPTEPSTGMKYIYLCKVLTGEFVKGSSSLRVPPSKASSERTDAQYDSVVDDENQPNIFVIFNDTQAYPEFLITLS